jgi:hypothetical protein
MGDPATDDPGQFVAGGRQPFDRAVEAHDLAARRAVGSTSGASIAVRR